MSERLPLLTATEVAARLNVSKALVYRWAREAVVPSVVIGGIVRFRPEDVDALIAREAAS